MLRCAFVKRVNLSLPDETFERVEEARGDVSRSRFILRAVESALGAQPEKGPAQSRPPLTEYQRGLNAVDRGLTPPRPPDPPLKELEALRRHAVAGDGFAKVSHTPVNRADAFRRAQGKK